MSKHRMTPGRTNSGKETTEVPEDTKVEEEQTTQPAEETAVEIDGPIESAEESAEESSEAEESETETVKRKIDSSRVVAYGVLPGIALLLAMVVGYLKWQDDSNNDTDISSSQSPASEAMQTAKDSTIAILSYKPDTVEKQLNDARDLLTGEFQDSYTSLINDVVIPGAKQKGISAVASVPAVASVSADPSHAVVLVLVNQTAVVGQDAPTDTASSVRVTMEKVGDRWLISQFDPV